MRAINTSQFVGQRFGKWTVLDAANLGNSRHKKLLARCDCGVVRPVHLENLKSLKSTGCRKCSGMQRESNPSWSGYKDIPGQFWGILVRGAKEREINVDITIEDLQDVWLLQGGKCALSGLDIKLCAKRDGLTASVDRIDSALGYVKGNIQFVHKDVNLMKNKFNQEYFIEMCRNITGCMAA